VRPDGLGKLKNDLVGYRTGNIPVCKCLNHYATACPVMSVIVKYISTSILHGKRCSPLRALQHREALDHVYSSVTAILSVFGSSPIRPAPILQNQELHTV
jgi:hypothetical protein